MKGRLIIGFAVGVILATGCRKSFDIDLPYQPKPVINCLIHPDSMWNLNLIWSSSPTGAYVFSPVRGAQVSMQWAGQQVLLNRYDESVNSRYSNPDQRVPSQENTVIGLTVTIGDTVVTAYTHIPPKPVVELNVNSLEITPHLDQATGRIDGYGVSGSAILKIVRPAGGQRYYTLSAGYRPYTMYGSDPYSRDKDVFSDFLSVRTDDRRCIASITWDEGYLIDLGTDEPDVAEFFIDIQGGIHNPYEPLEYFVISVNSVTAEYFAYNRKIRDQYISSLDPFGEPVRIPSNLEGGLGIFSGYNSTQVVVGDGDW